MDAEGKVGLAYQMEGSKGLLRLDRQMDLITADGRGRFSEATSRNQVFHLNLLPTTTGIAAGNVHNAAAAASTNFALWNPLGSGKNLELLRFGLTLISGTTPAGGYAHSFATICPTIASTGVAYSGLVGITAPSVARWMTSAGGSALTGGGALTMLRQGTLSNTAGTLANLAGLNLTEFIDGDIILPPGTMWVPTWASTAALILGYSITWMEVPIPS